MTMRKTKLSYDEFVRWYTGPRTSIEREKLRIDNPKHSAKFNLLDGLGGLKEGSTVFVIVRKHGRNYSKSISLFTFAIRTDAGYHASKDNPALQPLTLTYNVARLMGYNTHDIDGRDVIRTDDYPQEFVAHLSQCLFGIDKASALRCEIL